MKAALATHKLAMSDINFNHNLSYEISAKLHEYSAERAQYIFNSVTCKKYPEILKKAMLSTVQFSHGECVNSLEIYKNNGFNINQPIKEEYYSWENLLEFALQKTNEKTACKLLELGSAVTDTNIRTAIKEKSSLIKILLEKRPDFRPTNEDFDGLVRAWTTYESSKTKVENQIVIDTLRLFCKRVASSPDILVLALSTGKFEFAKILMEEFSIALPETLSEDRIASIIKNCELSDLITLNLSIPKNILVWKEYGYGCGHSYRKFYKEISSKKIQFCVDRGASIELLTLDAVGVLQSPEIVKQLIQLKKDIDPPCVDEEGNCCSLLHLAAKYGHPETLQLLIAEGINIEVTTDKGWTPLHYAAAYNNPAAIKVLFEAGANLDSVDANKQTPLHVAVITGTALSVRNIPAANILLFCGANPGLKDSNDKTPLESLYTGGCNPWERVPRWNRVFESKPYFSEIRTNSQIIAQACRTGTSFFARIEEKHILHKIASLMGKNPNRIEEDNESYVIAQTNFGKPA